MIELNLLERHGFTVKALCRYPYWEISAKGQKWLIGREDGELVSATPWLKEALVAIREHYAPILQHPVYRSGTPDIRKQCWLLVESTGELEGAIAYLEILGSKKYMDRCESFVHAVFKVEPPAGGFKKAKKLTDQIVEILLANPSGLLLEQIQLALIGTEWATEEESIVRETLRRLEANERVTRSWAKLPGQRRDRRLFFAVQSQQVAS